MITAWDMYWLTRLEALNFVLAAFWLISLTSIIIFTVLFLIVRSVDGTDSDEFRQVVKFKFVFHVFVALSIFSIFVPNMKDIALIYFVPKITNSESVKTFSEEMPELSKLAIERIKELLTVESGESR